MKYFRPGFICRPPLLVVWNQQAKTSNVDLSGGLLTATCNASADGGVAGTLFKNTGKWYAELNCSVVGGGDTGAGLAGAAAVLATMGGSAANVMLQFKSGNVYKNGSLIFANGNMSGGGILRLAYDAGAHLAWTAFAAGPWNANGAFDPGAGSGGQSTTAFDGTYGLVPVFAASVSGDVCVANFGASSFTYSAPTGFTAWNG